VHKEGRHVAGRPTKN